MGRFSDRYRSRPLWIRLSIPVAVVVLIVILMLNGFLLNYASSLVHRQIQDAAHSSVIRAQSYVDMRLRSIIERLYYIKLDPSVSETLSDFLLADSVQKEAVTMTAFARSLSLYKVTEPLSAAMFLYTPNGIFTENSFSVSSDFDFSSSALWQSLQEQTNSVVFAHPQRDEIFITHRDVIPVMHRFYVAGYPEECVILTNIDRTRLTDYLSEILVGDGSEVLLVEADGTPVSYPNGKACAFLAEHPAAMDAALNSTDAQTYRLGAGDYMLAALPLESAPWRILYVQPMDAVQNVLLRMTLLFAALTCLAAALIFIATVRIANGITSPLTRFCQHIRKDGELLPFSYEQQDEVGTLARNYNEMVQRIQLLLQSQEEYIEQLKQEKARVQQEQQQKRLAELRALQAQIHPHFLYNTLDSIRWKAELAGAEDISQMTTALANLFRISLSRGREIISLEQEEKHAASYLQIQKYRYGEKLNYEINIPQELRSLHTVKLVLQPLVENAIYHGIKEKDKPGTIRISGWQEDNRLFLRVEDDGMGIPAEKLALLRRNLANCWTPQQDGYGIYNVNERIRLYFGTEYGLNLDSVWGQGTTATLSLPCITGEEAEKYVSDNRY